MNSISTAAVLRSQERPTLRIRSWLSRGLWLALLIIGPIFPAHRELFIASPVLAAAEAKIKITILASTDARGERVGFLHGEYSIDDGQNWTGFCYEENAGSSATRSVSFKVGAAGSKALVRVRAAYRGGAAGDVDCNGEAIRWTDTWSKWQMPPAKITVTSIITP